MRKLVKIFQNMRARIETRTPQPILNALVEAISFFSFVRFQQILRIKRLTRDKPLILRIETISACNARCVFCAYPDMTRAKEILPSDSFEKALHEYSEMGGGAISLTPIMGDVLLDPHLMDRFKLIQKYSKINQVSFTTNGIALDRYSDDDLKQIIDNVFVIQFSIGGLDRETYNRLYKVDCFDQVIANVNRMIQMRNGLKSKMEIILAFRTDNPNFEEEHRSVLDTYREKGVLISHISTYHNYGGEIQTDVVSVRKGRGTSKQMVCGLPLIQAGVYSNGQVTACGCEDANGQGLNMGSNKTEDLQSIWNGEKRKNLLDSFAAKSLPDLCKSCSAYRPYSYLFALKAFDKVVRGKLPLDFYFRFFGP